MIGCQGADLRTVAYIQPVLRTRFGVRARSKAIDGSVPPASCVDRIQHHREARAGIEVTGAPQVRMQPQRFPLRSRESVPGGTWAGLVGT